MIDAWKHDPDPRQRRPTHVRRPIVGSRGRTMIDVLRPESLSDHRNSRRHGHGRWARGPRGNGPWRRGRDNRLVAGVAAGLAARRGFDVTFVRIAFVVAALASGFGVAAYVVAWLLVPAADERSNIASKALTDR